VVSRGQQPPWVKRGAFKPVPLLSLRKIVRLGKGKTRTKERAIRSESPVL